jgi:hypothetical protein|uniref:Uncharacterized protein n=1 Tax=CrAss-like virus sp. ctt4r3 TaxID=2823619 RepID=A0A8S5L7E1_9CAUD|nr:MAG TPA: hypothetical protein [CrAss-like virus sp. ctt4r3]
MATKSQLKEYFKSLKIPTEAQFGTLIDSFINNPSTDITERPNQNLFFGNGEENPYIQGIRTISKADDGSNGVVNMWIFSTYNNNDGELAIPMFILMRTSTKNPGLLPANNSLRYCIPNVENIETFVQSGIDCNTSTDDDIISVVYSWEFKPFEKSDNITPDVINVEVRIPIGGDIYTNMSYTCLMGGFNYDGAIVKLPVQITWMMHNSGSENIDLQGIYDIKSINELSEYENYWLPVTEDANYSTGLIVTESNTIHNAINDILNAYFKKRA